MWLNFNKYRYSLYIIFILFIAISGFLLHHYSIPANTGPGTYGFTFVFVVIPFIVAIPLIYFTSDMFINIFNFIFKNNTKNNSKKNNSY
jgi:hypothetical protein